MQRPKHNSRAGRNPIIPHSGLSGLPLFLKVNFIPKPKFEELPAI